MSDRRAYTGLGVRGRGESYCHACDRPCNMLGGCMQGGTLAPATQAGWSARDQQLMSNLPYRQAIIAEEYRRHIVQYARNEAPGTIVIDTGNKFL